MGQNAGASVSGLLRSATGNVQPELLRVQLRFHGRLPCPAFSAEPSALKNPELYGEFRAGVWQNASLYIQIGLLQVGDFAASA